MHADNFLKLLDYWTEVTKSTQSVAIANDLFKIRMSILQSVSERQGCE